MTLKKRSSKSTPKTTNTKSTTTAAGALRLPKFLAAKDITTEDDKAEDRFREEMSFAKAHCAGGR